MKALSGKRIRAKEETEFLGETRFLFTDYKPI